MFWDVVAYVAIAVMLGVACYALFWPHEDD